MIQPRPLTLIWLFLAASIQYLPQIWRLGRPLCQHQWAQALLVRLLPTMIGQLDGPTDSMREAELKPFGLNKVLRGNSSLDVNKRVSSYGALFNFLLMV